ncbi:MAG: ABC transporter substrate-binding protein [Candidatus Kariarchaeaceae archaeon]|jgi:ABC-type transport system substrate-binding protein
MNRNRGITCQIAILLLLLSSLGYINNYGNIGLAQETQKTEEIREIGFVLVWDWNMTYGLSPWTSPGSASAQMLAVTYGGLYRRSSELKYVPMFAEDLPSKEGLVWTVNLKPNLKFANGNPLTADDVVFTYRVALTPEINTAAYDFYARYFDDKSSIVALDEYTVQFTFKEPSKLFMEILSHTIVEQAQYSELYTSCLTGNEDACIWDDPSGSYANGTGPFIVKDISDLAITFERNEHYYEADKIQADRLVFIYNKTIYEAIELFSKETVHIMEWSYQQAGYYDKNNFTNPENVSIVYLPLSGWQEISVNHLHPVFGTGLDIPNGIGISDNDDVQALLVRKALSHIVNREKIVNEILEGGGRAAASSIGPGLIGFDDTLEPRNYSIATARNYMQMAGYDYSSIVDSNQDGDYGDPNDTTFFNISILAINTNRFRNMWIEDYANELPKIGIGVKLVNWSFWDSYDERVWNYPDGIPDDWPPGFFGLNNTHPNDRPPVYDEGGYDIAFVGLFGDHIYWSGYKKFSSDGICDVDPDCGAGGNWYNYDNNTVEQLISSYEEEFDEDASIEMMRNIQKALYDDLPVIPIVFEADKWVLHKDIEGLHLNLLALSQEEWYDVRMSYWTPRDPGEADDNGGIPETPVLVIGAGIIVLAVVSTYFLRRKKKNR